MANVHYNRTTTLERREKIIAIWTSGSKQAQIVEEVGLSPQTVSNIVNKFLQRGTYFPGKPGWKERTVSTPDVVEFVEYSNLLNLAVTLQKSGKHSLVTEYVRPPMLHLVQQLATF